MFESILFEKRLGCIGAG